MSFPAGPHELVRLNYASAAAARQEAQLHAGAMAAIDANGFVCLEDVVQAADCDAILAEMRPYTDTTPHGVFGLGSTRRVGALVARSPTSHSVVAHPAVLRLVQSILGEQQLTGSGLHIAPASPPRPDGGSSGYCGKGDHDKGLAYPWHLMLTQMLDIAPGGGTEASPHSGAQLYDGVKLHKANGRWHHNFPGQDLQVEVMWALTDFTEENGATHIVLGSNRETPRDGDLGYTQPAIQATMRKGSALVWTGWSIHGAGVNRSAAYRTGLNVDYALAFLAQEENQILACPPHLARKLPRSLQDLIGYNDELASGVDCQLPVERVLQEGYDILVPGAHLLPLDPVIDAPLLTAPQELEATLADLAEKKAKAIAHDDLELALRCKNAITTAKRRVRLQASRL
jgi:ectoine hydroxylase-related dioxygenase (phytanoyl-CoA dioxygenase family)